MTDFYDDTEPLDEARRRQRAGNDGADLQEWRYTQPKLRPVTWPEGPVPARKWMVYGLIPHRAVTYWVAMVARARATWSRC